MWMESCDVRFALLNEVSNDTLVRDGVGPRHSHNGGARMADEQTGATRLHTMN